MGRITEQDIVTALPQIMQIRKVEWQKAICRVWMEVFEQSNWEKLDDARFHLECPHISLIQHVNSVTDGAVALAGATQKIFGTAINYDELIAICLFHDVSKLIEMEDSAQGPRKSKIGKMFQHGYYSAYYAQKNGLNENVVANIIAHTGLSKAMPSTPEGVIMFYADMADADMHHLEANIPLNIRHHK